jgi:hypothetical protein
MSRKQRYYQGCTSPLPLSPTQLPASFWLSNQQLSNVSGLNLVSLRVVPNLDVRIIFRQTLYVESNSIPRQKRILFYYLCWLDPSESSMLVSAGFKNNATRKQLIRKDFKALL